jgi:hypothetical protein
VLRARPGCLQRRARACDQRGGAQTHASATSNRAESVARRRVSTNLIHTEDLTATQKRNDERIRTLCFVILAAATTAGVIYYLRPVLVPFFLALALKYLLTPLINVLSCDPLYCGARAPAHLAAAAPPCTSRTLHPSSRPTQRPTTASSGCRAAWRSASPSSSPPSSSGCSPRW